MEKTITTALLVIASIVATVALINAVMPAVGKGSGALLQANSDAADRIKTDIEIVFASGNSTGDEITFWVKNVGTKVIKTESKSDVFLTTSTTFKRISFNSSCSASLSDCWKFNLEGGSAQWTKSATIKVSMFLTGDSVATGLHTVKMAVVNAVTAEKDFSL